MDEKKERKVWSRGRFTRGNGSDCPPRKVGEILNGSGNHDEILVVNGVIGNHAHHW